MIKRPPNDTNAMRPLHWASQYFRVPKTKEGDKDGLRSQKSAKNPIFGQN